MGFIMATPARVNHPHIVKERDYCGGKAAIDKTGVRVMNVVFLHKRGAAEKDILEAYPDLDRAQIYAALAYYYDHPEEIDEELRNDETAAERYEAERASDLSRRKGK
jgi:uncharacterized protein (DUF433 family)